MNDVRPPSLVRRIKQRYRRSRLARLGVREVVACNKRSLGQGSGAWTVCPDDIGPGSVVYSFGVGTDISFDLEVHRMTGAQVHLFDPTPRSIEWVHAQHLPDGISFHEFGIGDHDGTIRFHPPRRATSSHYSPVKRYARHDAGETLCAPVFTLASIASRLGHERVDLLKMDIEGGEYDVIRDIADRPVPIGQLLVEFHHAYSTIPIERTVEGVRMLENMGLQCFHISERTYEMSFVHRAR